jgi:outer membrane protein insertion porin family
VSVAVLLRHDGELWTVKYINRLGLIRENMDWLYRLRCLVIMLCGFLIFSPSQVRSDETSQPQIHKPTVTDILIHLTDIQRDWQNLIETANNLIYLKKSEPFSSKLLEDSIQALRLSKKFSHIHVDSEESPEGISIIFSLTPFRYIKDIKFSGAQPVFEQRILSAITIYTGNVFIKNELAQQTELIKNLFIEEGFFEPEVNVDIQKDPEDGNVVLRFVIQKGEYFRINQLGFIGNQNVSSKRLKLRMRTWQNSFLPGYRGRFIENELITDINRLVEFYRNKNFANVNINYEIEKNPEKNDVTVLVSIEEGPYYEVSIEGNERFWNLTLRNDVVIFDEGNLQDMGLRKSIRNMKERYREAGFLETQINFEETHELKNDRTVRHITFLITEGPRYVVENVNIFGNTHFEDRNIQQQMLTSLPGIFDPGHYIPEILELDTIAIKTLYAQEGYVEPLVQSDVDLFEETQKAVISINIEEGPQTIVETTKIKGLNVLSEKEAFDAISLKPGLPFRSYMVRSDENALAGLISPYGYPHVRVIGKVDFSPNRTKANVVFEVDEGPFVRMGQIYYSGNFRTKDFVISREVEMEAGEPFSLVRMLEGQRAIQNMNIFNSVQFKTIGLREKADDIHLFVEMEERKPYYIQTGLGYQTDLGTYINLRAGDRNFLGRNKAVWIGGSLSEIGYRGEAWYSEPRLFGARIQSDFGIFAEKREEFNKNFGVRIHGASMGVSRKWTPHFSTGLAARYENRERYDTNGVALGIGEEDINEEQFRSRNLVVIAPSIVYDTRDSIIRPRQGLFTTVSADISQGLDNDLDSFIKYKIDGRYYRTSTSIPWLTLAFLGRAGYIDPRGNVMDVPDDQLFFLGGITDVRGFRENMLLFDAAEDPVGGRFSINGSFEARIDLGRNFELTAFLDAGRINNTEIPVDDTDLRSSAGIGLRYVTPIGPIGLLYGHKIDKKDGESSGRFHFSMGYTF